MPLKHFIRRCVMLLVGCTLFGNIHAQCPTATTQGNDFWVMFLLNYEGASDLSLFAAGEENAVITVHNPYLNWSTSVNLTGGSRVNIPLPLNVATSATIGTPQNAGLHITSTSNISLYASNFQYATFDISTILPTSSLRSNYIVQDYPSNLYGSEIGVVATENNTHVAIHLTAPTTNNYSTGNTINITLNAGQTYQILTPSGYTFSGTQVTSDKPIAVFQGNQCVNVPQGYAACDHLYEQSIPTDYWGKDFVLVPPALRSGGDRVRVTASEDNCQLFLDGTLIQTLQARQTYEFHLPSGNAHKFNSSQPVLVCLYISGGEYGGQPGDPAAVVIPPIEQGVCDVIFDAFNTNQTTNHYTNIVTRIEHVQGMRLDGANIASQFVTLDTTYSYAKLLVTAGAHKLSNTIGNFSAYFYGLGYWESYAYTAGMGLRNLRNELIINGEESHSWGESITICYTDTIHFQTRTNGEDTAVLWYIDGVLQQSNGSMSLSHHFNNAGTYELMALMHGLCDTQWCDTMRAIIHVEAPFAGTVQATVCDSGYTYRGITYTTSGTYNTFSPVEQGCDSLFTLQLTVNHSTSSTVDDTVVQNQLPYIFLGTSFNGEANTLFHLTNSQGCDSTIHYSLHVHWNKYTYLDSTVCDDQLPLQWNGVLFPSANTGTALFSTVQGADSVVTMTLHVNPTYHDTLALSICNNQSHLFEGTIYSDSGTYSHLLYTAVGCDSLRTLILSLRDTTTHSDTIDICDNYLWHGTTYTSSINTSMPVGPNAIGCDSTDYLFLNVRYSSVSTYLDTVVEDQLPRQFNGTLFTDSVSHATVTINNAAGCDSIIDYSLYVHWNVDTTLYDTVCNDALPLIWNGVIFDTTLGQSATMTRVTVIATHSGADSTITMHLTVHPLFDHHTYTEICDNQQYLFGDSLFLGSNGSTLYLDSLLSIHHCDSLSTLHLTIHPTFDHHTFDTICSNQSIVFTGVTYTATGIYPHTLQSQHMCDSISTLNLQVWPAYDIHTYDTICDDSSRFFIDSAYRQTGTYPYHFFTSHVCDSLQTLHLKVYPTYDIHFFDTIYDGDLFTFESTVYDTTGIYPHLLQAVFGCDSLRTLHLQRNRRTYVDSILCQNSLPLTWNGITFTEGQGLRGNEWQTFSDSVHLSGLDGIDSLVVMTVIARDTSSTIDQIHSCDSLLWRDGILYRSSTTDPFVILQNHWGCDSVRHLNLTVDHTHHFIDRREACDSMQWRDRRWYFRDTLGVVGPVGSHLTSGPVDSLTTVGGCDSMIALDLSVFHSTYEETLDTFCYNQTYPWRQFLVHSDSVYLNENFYLTDTLRTIHHCDSVLAIRLTKIAKPTITFHHESDCKNYTYSLTGTTDVPYFRWSSAPHDSLLDGQEYQSDIIVSPQIVTDYILYVDYQEEPFCPYTESIRLNPIDIPEAVLHVNPELLKYNAMDFHAYDASKEYEDRTWYIDWVEQSETSRHLEGQGSIEQDSLVIALRVYNGMCYDTATQVLPILKVSVVSPNVFTPDLDNNNRFTLFVDGVIDGELFIYTREGLFVYSTKDYEHQGWDGSGCPQGAYVWRLNYHAIDYPNKLESIVGTVLLLR